MSEWSFDELAGEVLANPNARAAAGENDIRRKLSAAFERARSEKGLSVRALASAMGTSVSQVQRLLHNEVGGTLTLRTLVRAADTLDLSLSMHARPRCDRPAKVLSFGNAGDHARVWAMPARPVEAAQGEPSRLHHPGRVHRVVGLRLPASRGGWRVTTTATIEACKGCDYTDKTQHPPEPFAPQCPVCLRFVAFGDLRDPDCGVLATHYYDPNTGRVEMYPAPSTPPPEEDAQ